MKIILELLFFRLDQAPCLFIEDSLLLLEVLRTVVPPPVVWDDDRSSTAQSLILLALVRRHHCALPSRLLYLKVWWVHAHHPTLVL